MKIVCPGRVRKYDQVVRLPLTVKGHVRFISDSKLHIGECVWLFVCISLLCQQTLSVSAGIGSSTSRNPVQGLSDRR